MKILKTSNKHSWNSTNSLTVALTKTQNRSRFASFQTPGSFASLAPFPLVRLERFVLRSVHSLERPYYASKSARMTRESDMAIPDEGSAARHCTRVVEARNGAKRWSESRWGAVGHTKRFLEIVLPFCVVFWCFLFLLGGSGSNYGKWDESNFWMVF